MAENTLGQMVGRIEHTFSVAQEKGQPGVQTTAVFDFTGCTDAEIKSWLVGNRTIALQRPMRDLSADEIKAFKGTVVPASSAGSKIRSREEQMRQLVATFVSAGVEPGQAKVLAEAALNNPSSLQVVGSE